LACRRAAEAAADGLSKGIECERLVGVIDVCCCCCWYECACELEHDAVMPIDEPGRAAVNDGAGSGCTTSRSIFSFRERFGCRRWLLALEAEGELAAVARWRPGVRDIVESKSVVFSEWSGVVEVCTHKTSNQAQL
jgi:hypothetical protein